MKCLNVAHAGYDGYVPNSLASIEGITKSTCDVLEMDVRRAGARIYLSHDHKEVSDDCVSLEMALIYMKENAPDKLVGIDLKEPVFEQVQELVWYCGMDGKIIYSGDFLLKDLLKNRGKNKVFYNLENSIKTVNNLQEKESELLDLFRVLKQCGADGVNMEHRLFDGQMAEKLLAHDLAGAVWTVDREEDLKRMLVLGADSITTRYPEKLTELMAKGDME